ncbi:Protein of unknown function [Colwellia chukchiensis]|uniref:DUF2750 domain-containing protein n=1 Tax=Colwellia chukchiensis TaxID=641665 RepID=A0A1H7SK81_9GAMM|nr:DUF2750 domain-containing protein [Colwellia chukchiensis]SEL73081.1 Protein of unknown function [Colwellia chukchiensis]
MTDQVTLTSFLNQVKDTQSLWALQDKASEDWVVLDSINFKNADVLPVWSSEALAKSHCVEQWSDYQTAEISVADWMEFWVEDLLADGVVIGVNWQDQEPCMELELPEFTQAIATIEAL